MFDREVRSTEVEYPSRDGRPMTESDRHSIELVRYVLELLRELFARRRGVYVAGNHFVYYVKGDPSAVVSPDCYVVKGVSNRLRESFKVWEEGGRAPSFVLELTSRSTKSEDLGAKLEKYRDVLRVREYFLFDPRREWIAERLRGLRLVGGEYVRIEPGPNGRLRSRELGLELAESDGHVRFFLPGAAEPIPTALERAERERARADRAERELAKLRAQLKRRRRKRSS